MKWESVFSPAFFEQLSQMPRTSTCVDAVINRNDTQIGMTVKKESYALGAKPLRGLTMKRPHGSGDNWTNLTSLGGQALAKVRAKCVLLAHI
jgi:hypothetical protein